MKDNWKITPLRELVKTIKAGGTPSSTNPEFYNGDIPFVSIEDITDSNKRLKKTKKFLSKKGIDASAAWKVPKGYLVYSMYASVGKVRHLDIDAATSQAIIAINNDSTEIEKDYLYYFLLKLEREIYKYTSQTTQANLNAEKVKSFKISYPPLPKQKKIAKILSTVDAVIEKTESAIAKYQAIKQGLMHDLFTRGIDVNTGKLRPTPQEAPELYKESALGLIPREWEVEELGNLSNKVTDGTHFTPNYTESGIPFLRVTDVQTNKIEFDKIKYVSKKEHNELIKRCYPEKGDILYSKNGTIGIPKLVDWDWEFSIFVSLALIKPRIELIKSEYLLQLLPEEIIWKQIRQRAKQGTVTNLHLEEIREFLIPLPTKKEQEAICKRGIVIKNKIQIEQQALAKYQQIKAGLLQDLLTGKVAVSVD